MHSSLKISDYQYRKAFRKLFPKRRLRDAVAVRRRTTRERKMPLYLLLSVLISWFLKPNSGLAGVVGWLVPRRKRIPTDGPLYRARQNLGWAPLRWLRKHFLKPLASLGSDPYAFYQGLRLLAIDGTTFTVADTPANARTFGRANNQHGPGGYPLARAVALCEVGTHALLAWCIRSYRRSEGELARRLLGRVPGGTLLLADRNFHSYEFWQAAKQGDYQLLLRVQKGPKFPIETVLPDGSYLSRVLPRRGKHKKARALTVRVIPYAWTDANGKRQESRLLSSLVDAVSYPAVELMALYHQRWEHELVFKEIKEQLTGKHRSTHVRAKDPLGVCQELEGMLLGHYVVRWTMLQASRQAGVPAVALSFSGALEVLQVALARIPNRRKRAKQFWRRWWEDLLADLGERRVRPRTGRSCPRVRKVTRSHWPLKKGQKEGKVPILEIVPTILPADPPAA